MADIDQAAALGLREAPRRSPLLKWGLIAIAVLTLVGAGGGGWYFLLGGREHFSSRQGKEVEAPLPYFLEVKPFVVSMPGGNGVAHFVQLGPSLQLPRAAASEMATALLPEIQDTMRQTLLGFKIEDLQNPEGVNKVRKAMTLRLNELLSGALGHDRLAKITDGNPERGVVLNILFPMLIVE